jgi:hypothetical protein
MSEAGYVDTWLEQDDYRIQLQDLCDVDHSPHSEMV